MRDDGPIVKPVRPVWGVVMFLLAAAPLVLLAAGWARTSSRSYYVAFFTPGGAVQGIATHGGRLVVAFSNLSLGRERGLTALCDGVVPREFDRTTYQLVYEVVGAKRERWGFGYAHGRAEQPAPNPGGGSDGGEVQASHLAVVMPLWLPTLLAAIAPLRIAMRGLRRWRRWRTGRCLACGYDLRGSAGRCPECGTRPGDADPNPAAPSVAAAV